MTIVRYHNTENRDFSPLWHDDSLESVPQLTGNDIH